MYLTRHSCFMVLMSMLAAGPVSAQSWDGPYLGVHMGSVTADFSNQSPATPGPSGSATSAIGGVQLGYNWQNGSSVLGAEADVSFTDISDSFPSGAFEEDLMTSVRLRAGIMQGDTLIFGTLGVAWTETHSSLTGVGTSSDLTPGVMLGAGAERFLGENVTGRLEAYYVDVPAETRSTGGTSTAHGSQNMIFRAGLSLHF